MTKPLHTHDSQAFGEALRNADRDRARDAYKAYANAPSRCGRPDDTETMNRACAELHERMMKFERPTEHQLKIGPVNYYPNTGTVHIDGVKGAKRGLTQSQAFDLILKNYT